MNRRANPFHDIDKIVRGITDYNIDAVVRHGEAPRHEFLGGARRRGDLDPRVGQRDLIGDRVGCDAAALEERNPEGLEARAEHAARIGAVDEEAEGEIRSVKLTSRILPGSLAHEDYIRDRGFDLSGPLAEPVKVFEGSAGAAAKALPRHFNVAAALSLAGIGFERTQVEVWAEAGIAGAIHRVEVDAADIQIDLTSWNRPSDSNPRTSRAVAPSVMAALRALTGPLKVGS